jgi:long-chain acyl-CoA synthetase
MAITRIFDFLKHQVDHLSTDKSFATKEDGKWSYLSSEAIFNLSQSLGAGLLDQGFSVGDNIGIVAYKNRPEWVIADLAIQQAGMISVPLYPTISTKEYQYIFEESQLKACFVGTGDLAEKIKGAQNSGFKKLFVFDKENDAGIYWKDICIENTSQLHEISQKVRPDNLATIIYTSGTTGNPKGVMLSHENIVSNIKMVKELIPLEAGDRVLSFLPLCHVFERAATYVYIYFGATVYQTGTDNLGGERGDIKSVTPHFFTCVPRLLEKIYDKINSKGMELKGIKRKLFFWALKLAETYEYDMKKRGLKWRVADKLIFSKWRGALGGSVKGIVTGAAPCPEKICRVFSAAGISIREAYGLTEASPGLTGNTFIPGDAILGTVGMAFKGVELKISDDHNLYEEGEGEILAAGSNIMQGYYKQPELTDEVIKLEDGKRWLLTGDVGRFKVDPKGRSFLVITDRKKELLKTSGGKYVAPGPIESKLKESQLIDNVLVVGDQRKFVLALIVPAEEGLKKWMTHKKIEFSNLESEIENNLVIQKYENIVETVNESLGKVEKIKKFILLNCLWEPIKQDGTESELTPTLKLKRRVILQKFSNHIEKLYED